MNTEPVDREDKQTERVRQGTGPRAMVSVLVISVIAAVVILVAIFGYFALM